MSQDLTERQAEYLDFIRNYIQENRSAPRLDEIAGHFGVTSPTAHRALETLQEKGKLYFGRDTLTGFYIRLFANLEVVTSVCEIAVLGSVDQYGIVRDFPQKVGHFATLPIQSQPQDLFALHVAAPLPIFNLAPQDIIILDQGREPQIWDLCLAILKGEHVLFQIQEIVEETGKFSWMTLDEDDEQNPLISRSNPLPQLLQKEFILATAWRLTRQLAF